MFFDFSRISPTLWIRKIGSYSITHAGQFLAAHYSSRTGKKYSMKGLHPFKLLKTTRPTWKLPPRTQQTPPSSYAAVCLCYRQSCKVTSSGNDRLPRSDQINKTEQNVHTRQQCQENVHRLTAIDATTAWLNAVLLRGCGFYLEAQGRRTTQTVGNLEFINGIYNSQLYVTVVIIIVRITSG